MLTTQLELNLSFHSSLYDLVIPDDHLLRKIKELVDFTFVLDELKSKYCLDNGRRAVDPIQMFKYLLLKHLYSLSDASVVERARYDLSFKYFLDLNPESEVIDSSSLTKFRKLRLKDVELLDILIAKSVNIAINQGVLKSNSLIVDSTHSNARYHKSTVKEMLMKQAKKLTESVSSVKEDIQLPQEPKRNANTEEAKGYCKKLITFLQKEALTELPDIKEKAELLEEMINDNEDCYDHSTDTDARIGYKSPNQSFYGFKTHLAMNEDRIITAATVTPGNAFDGEELPELVRKSQEAGVIVDEVIGDIAYSTTDNLKELSSANINLISKLNPSITNGSRSGDDFIFNKDANMIQCPAGHLAFRVYLNKRIKEKKNPQMVYSFDVAKCQVCPKREGCYKPGSKTKRYCVTLKSKHHKVQEEFESTDYFKERIRLRYMIESKNSELKNQHGYNYNETKGLGGMTIQGAVSIFAVNLKRIVKLTGGVCPKAVGKAID